MSTASTFARKLASVAEGEYDDFHLQDENDPGLSKRIKTYWTTLGMSFPGVGTAWSAVFVSFCVKTAGAVKSEFTFAAAHSIFVNDAIKNRDAGKGVFQAFDLDEKPPEIGDIIQNNRGGTKHDYAFARRNRNYESHSAIVIESGSDSGGGYVLTIGGNESDSIRKKLIRLNKQGFVQQRASNPYICIIKDLK